MFLSRERRSKIIGSLLEHTVLKLTENTDLKKIILLSLRDHPKPRETSKYRIIIEETN